MKSGIVVLAVLIGLTVQVSAYEGTSIGLILGIPTGMNIKIWIAEKNALNVNFGYHIFDKLLFMNADFLRHFDLFYRAPFYAGGGLALQVDNQTSSDKNFKANLRLVLGEDIWLGDSGLVLFWEGGGLATFYDGRWFRGGSRSIKGTAAIGLHYYLSH